MTTSDLEANKATHDDLNSLLQEIRGTRIKWNEKVLSSSTALFGILVALGNKDNMDAAFRYTTAFALLILSIGILCALVALRVEIHVLERLYSRYKEQTLPRVSGPISEVLIHIKLPAIFSYTGYVGAALFALTIIALCANSMIYYLC